MPTIIVGDLDVARAAAGPANGPIVRLLRGWPDDAPTIAATWRGFGETRFRSDGRQGIMGGGGTTPDSHLALMLDRLVRRYPFGEANQAIDDGDAGATIKPVLML